MRQLKRTCALWLILMGIGLFAAAVMGLPSVLAATISFVQVNAATPQAAQNTVTVTYLAAQSAGNLNIIVVGWNDATRLVSSVTDSQNNIYSLAVGPTVNSAGGLSQSIYYAKNIKAAAAGSNIVTVTFDGAAAFPDIRILEYTGADLTVPVDVTTTGTGNSTTSSTAAVSTTYDSDLLFAANMVSTTTTGAGVGFTSRIITSPDADIAEDQLVAATGSYSATATLSPSGQWVMQMVALRAAASSPSDTTPPTAPTNLTATVASATQINLSWTASTDNVGVTGYMVERCQGAGCSNFAQIATPAGTTYNDTGLSLSSYSYRVRSTDAAANLSGYSNTASADTSVDTTPPAAPTNLTATAASATQINLSWTASTDNVAVTGYMVERCQGAGCSNFAQIATPAGTTYNDTGRSPSTSYSYRVRATDASANLSGYSNTASASTPADTTPPAAPTSLTATPVSSTQINLSWTASTDDVGVTGYRVERCQGAGCSNFAQIATPAGTTYNDTGLAASTSYSYRVRATDAAGNLSPYSNTASATTPASQGPGTITFVQVNAATPQSALSTVTVTYLAAQSAGNLNIIVVGWNDATRLVTSVTDSQNNIYSLAVGPTVNSAGGLSQSIYYAKNIKAAAAGSNIVTVTFNGAADHPDIRALEYTGVDLAVPVDVTATGTGSGTTSSTAAVNTTNGSDLLFAANMVSTTTTGAGAGFTSRIITSPDADIAEDRLVAVTGSYSATAILSPSGQWVIQMVALRAAGSGPDTTAPSAPTNLTATAASTTQINLSWTASNDNVAVTGYMVERCQGAGCSNFAQIATPAGTTYNDTGLTASVSYSYRVRATDAAANLSGYSNTASAIPAADTTAPSAPTNLTATIASATQINLSWTASTDNVGVTGYRVERCQGAGCSNFAQIATPAGTTYSDTGLTASNYTYRVRATDAAGNLGPYSNNATASNNPIVVENQQPGSPNWQLGDVFGRRYADDQTQQIKGYASAVSVNKGQSITFMVNVNPAQTYTIDVYRLGWYQGNGGRLMQTIGPLNGTPQPACPTNQSTGMIECSWAPAYTLAVPASWTSGIYVGVLKNAQSYYNYIVFCVRDDSRVAALLFQSPVNTYQAYNNYPSNTTQTGKSLYEHNSGGGTTTISGTTRAVKVSFDRPYASEGFGLLMLLGEINLLRWLEMSGYDVTYNTDLDTHLNASRLLNYRALLTSGHSEYWSKPMYDGAIAARDLGVNLGFFSSNSVFWQVRYEASSTGVQNRVMVCYKSATLDPNTDPTLETVEWRDAPVNRPEQALLGVEFTNGPNNGYVTYVVTNSTNWMYAGTGFVDGSTVPGIVGYEADRQVSGDPLPNAVAGTYVLLSHSPYQGSQGADYGNSSIYQAQSGAWVFASGTTVWSWSLDDFYPEGNVNTVDSRMRKATVNLINRFLGQ